MALRKFLYLSTAVTLLMQTKLCFSEVILNNNVSIASVNSEYNITQDLGQTAGNNLFHSFNQFNISSGETAVFSGNSNIANIITRISGGTPSNINGNLQSNIDGANLWLINPYGMIFGNNATIDISGSFYISTANYLDFENGDRLYTDSTTDFNTFSTENPTSLGFSSSDNSTVIINDSNFTLTNNGSINITSGPTNIHNSHFVTENGKISIVAVADITDIPTSNNITEIGTADVNITDSKLSNTGNSGEGIRIQGGKIVVEDSVLTNQSNTAIINISAQHLVLSNTSINNTNPENTFLHADEFILRDVNNLEDTGVVNASLNINSLKINATQINDVSLSSIVENLDTDSSRTNSPSLTINGEAFSSQALNTSVQDNQVLVSDLQENKETTTDNSPKDSDSNSSTNILKVSNTNAREFNLQQISLETSLNKKNSKHCTSSVKKSSFSVRQITFQPMPAEFNPGDLYYKFDLAQTNTDTSATKLIGLFKKCG